MPDTLMPRNAAHVLPFGPADRVPLRRTAEAVIIEYLLLGGMIHAVHDGQRAACVAVASEALDRWVVLGLPMAADGDGRRLFDPVEVANFIPWAGLFAQDRFWEDRFIATGRRLVQEFHAADDDPAIAPNMARLPERTFAVCLNRRFGPAAGHTRPTARLNLRLPLAGPAQDVVAIHATRTPGEAGVRMMPGRLEVALTGPINGAEIEASCTFTVRPAQVRRLDLPPTERALYLCLNEGLIQVSPRITTLAAALAGTVRDPLELGAIFRDFIHGSLVCGVLRYDQIPRDTPLDWLLHHRWFDCQLGSALMAGLCRARGIPARICGGHLMYRPAPTYHYWVEIWCPDTGWRGFDLLSWTLSAAGRDAGWRGVFSGNLDYRMECERLPRLFTGIGGIGLPRQWHLLLAPHPDGAETALCDRESGLPVFTDRLRFLPDQAAG